MDEYLQLPFRFGILSQAKALPRYYLATSPGLKKKDQDQA